MIYETVVTTTDAGGVVHIAPMGIQLLSSEDSRVGVLLQPFKPSTTLDNILASRYAVINCIVDVKIIAGCLTGRRDWPTLAAQRVPGARLAGALSHKELELTRTDDGERPQLFMNVLYEENHAPFPGFNRAQAAVVEAAILVSRLHLLATDKIDSEMRYLQIAVDKTAGPDEREAWDWLCAQVAQHRAASLQISGHS